MGNAIAILGLLLLFGLAALLRLSEVARRKRVRRLSLSLNQHDPFEYGDRG
jgi:hypothetical protein